MNKNLNYELILMSFLKLLVSDDERLIFGAFNPD